MIKLIIFFKLIILFYFHSFCPIFSDFSFLLLRHYLLFLYSTNGDSIAGCLSCSKHSCKRSHICQKNACTRKTDSHIEIKKALRKIGFSLRKTGKVFYKIFVILYAHK